MAQDFSVLIVEDDDDARCNMEDILSLDGYRIQSESHCAPAIDAVKAQRFDAVIVDWKLPDQNADALIRDVANHQPDTPVVVVTGMRDFDTAITALRSGAYDFLLKPINPDALRSVLNRMVERKKHLAAIENAQQQILINERLAAIGQMVTGLAHESRNALQRSHACLAELSLDLEHKPESMKLVHKIQQALDDLHGLLEEVRSYSAPIILERRQCNLASLVKTTWQQITDTTPDTDAIQFLVQVDQMFPEQTMVDVDRIGQVFRNLLENAMFACPDAGEITVTLGVTHSDTSQRRLRIEVSDNGAGVPNEHRESIFAPFFTTKTKGTGLGLAICRRYVDAHDGKLFVDPTNDAGARFVVELP